MKASENLVDVLQMRFSEDPQINVVLQAVAYEMLYFNFKNVLQEIK